MGSYLNQQSNRVRVCYRRLRAARTQNFGSRVTTLAIKLMHTIQKRWHRLRGYELLADVIAGVQFKDGAQVEQQAA
jgi:putative transposase